MTQSGRTWLAASACGLAVALLFVAGFVRTQTKQPAVAVLPLAANAPAPTAGERYLIKEYGGQVCIFAAGEALPRRNTGIYTATLPNEDQAMLEEGIWVSSQAELSSVLEDYGY
ncbi:MAG: hypothetical protein ACOX0U_05170 [Oscillospiraceae bacterium]